MYTIINRVMVDQLTSETKPIDLPFFVPLWFIQNYPYNYTSPSCSNQSIHDAFPRETIPLTGIKRSNCCWRSEENKHTYIARQMRWLAKSICSTIFSDILDLQCGFRHRLKISTGVESGQHGNLSLIMNTTSFIIIHPNVQNNCTLCFC